MNPHKSGIRENLRVIKTARTEDAINKAAKAGYFPVMKIVEFSDEFHSRFCVWQNRHTGEIRIVGSPRVRVENHEWKKVIDWTSYYPHHFPEPFAAYLIPPDIKEGELVLVEDLIENFIGASSGIGCNFRLDSCTAIWNGTDLTIQYDPSKDMLEFIG